MSVRKKPFTLHTSEEVEVIAGTILYDDVQVDDELSEVEFLGPPPVRQAIRLVPANRRADGAVPTLRERLRKLAPGGMVLMPRRRRVAMAR
jgi:hypothetical protein